MDTASASRLWWTLAGLGLLIGCGGDDGSGASQAVDAGGDPSDADACDYVLCDIRKEACQAQLASALSCARGGDAVMPPTRLITVDEYRELAQGSTDSGMLEVDAQLQQARQEQALADMERGLSLLRLGDPEVSSEALAGGAADMVAAAYLPETEEIVVIDHGMPRDGEFAVTTFVHELVHAMQDAEHGLDRLYGRYAVSMDRLLALRALTEGEAVHWEMLASVALEGEDAASIDWDAFYGDWQTEMLEQAAMDRSPLFFAPLRFPYAFGGDFVSRVYHDAGGEAAGADAVAALFDAPPLSTLQVLQHDPEPASEAQDEIAWGQVAEAGVPRVGLEYGLLAVENAGAWSYQVFLRRNGLLESGEGVVLDGASAVTQDVLTVQVAQGRGLLDDEGEPVAEPVVAAWRLRFETVQGAEDALARIMDGYALPESGADGDYVFATEAQELTLLVSDTGGELTGGTATWASVFGSPGGPPGAFASTWHPHPAPLRSPRPGPRR